MFETFSSFEDNFNSLSELQKEVYHEILRRYSDDMSPVTALNYARRDYEYDYYLNNNGDVDQIVTDIRAEFEEDTKPSDELLRVKKAIEEGRLKIVGDGGKKYGKLTLDIQFLTWARNKTDGYTIYVYDENDRHLGTIRCTEPDYIPEIVRGE